MSLSSSLTKRLRSSLRSGLTDVGGASGPSISLSAPDFGGSTYYEGVDDNDITVTINNATDGASWDLTISSSGGGTNVTASGTVSGSTVIAGAQNLTGLNAGTLTFSYEEGSVEVASRTRTLAVQAAPDAPTITDVSWSSEQATVTISAGPPNGAAITDHIWEYNEDGGGWTAFNAGTSTDLTGTTPALTKGNSVDFRVRSTNSIGTGSNSATSSSSVPTTVPGAVQSLAASPSTGQLAVTWSAPSDAGGSAITDYLIGYRLNSVGGAFTTWNDGVSASTGATITGLTDGVAYDIEVSAVNGVGIGTASTLLNQTPADGPSYDYYVDSVNGDDANAGTEAAPFQTLAQATTALASAGTSLALVRGSNWEEKFTVPRTGFTIGVTGSGAAPVFDGSKVIDGTWTAHADSGSYPDVWQQTVTRTAGGPTEATSLWADDVLPTYQDSLANLQANGGWHVSDLFGANPTFYIKSATDPNSNGVEYRFAQLDEGIAAHQAQGGESAYVTGPIELIRYNGAYGCYAGGQFDGGGTDKQLLFSEGAIHHMVSEAVTSDDCIALGVVPHGTASSAFTWYRADGAGFDPVVKRCGAWTGYDTHTEQLDRRGALYVHDSDFPAQCTASFEQTWSRAGERSVSASADSMTCQGHYSWNCASAWYGISVTNTVRYGISRQANDAGSSGYTDSGPAQTASKTVVIEDMVFFAPPSTVAGSLVGIAERNGDFTFRRCIFFMCDVDAPAVLLSANAETSIDLVVENCLFVRTVADSGGVKNTINLTETASTYVGTNNLFVGRSSPDGSDYIDLTIRGTTYRTLAAAQAAGYDANSVHIGESWDIDQIIENLFEGDPRQGDFRLKSDLSAYGTFGDSSALTTAGPQTHWDWNARATASGAPSQWPVPPWSTADCRTYIDAPASWDFYPAPSAVSDLAATADDLSIDLTWTQPDTDKGVSVASYSVEYKETSSGTWLTPSEITYSGASATVSGLDRNTSYDFRVTATNPSGSSGVSNTATETTENVPAQVGTVTPTAGTFDMALAWSAPDAGATAITDYEVEYKLTSASEWSVFADGTSASTGATVTGLSASTSYDFRVRAVSSTGNGKYSATVTQSTSAFSGFIDDFDRSNENLTDDANWDLGFGSASKLTINSNLMQVSTGSATVATQNQVASANAYAQAAFVSVSNGGLGLVVRYVDSNNYIRLDINASAWRIVKRVSGSETTVATYGTVAPVSNDVARLIADGDNVSLLVNGSEVIAPTSLSGDLASGTGIGVYGANNGRQMNDFQADTV